MKSEMCKSAYLTTNKYLILVLPRPVTPRVSVPPPFTPEEQSKRHITIRYIHATTLLTMLHWGRQHAHSNMHELVHGAFESWQQKYMLAQKRANSLTFSLGP